MGLRLKVQDSRNDGFTLLELTAAMTVMMTGLILLASVTLSTGRQSELDLTRQRVLETAESLMEQIKGTTPGQIKAAYNGLTYPVFGVQGTNTGGSVLSVVVDDTNTMLIIVTINGSWLVGSEDQHTLSLRTEIYDSKG